MTKQRKPHHANGNGSAANGSLSALTRACYADLSNRQKRIADVVLGNEAIIATYTATELATAAEVSKATVSRFVAKLGLSGFDVFREMARDDQKLATGSPLQIMADGLATTRGDLDALVQETFRLDEFNLSKTYADLSRQDLDTAVNLLCEAQAVVFADFRKQYALAYYATTLFRVIRPRVSSMPILGASPVDGTLDIHEDDVVVMFPFRRPERDQDLLSRVVVDSGATLITIGDIWPCPTSQRAHIHFACRTESAGVFDSFVAPMSLINLLFAATANRLDNSARQRLAELELKHVHFGTFDESAP